MTRQKKIHRHKFADRFPAIAAVLLLLITVALLQAAGELVNYPLAKGIPGYKMDGAIGFIVVSLIALWLYKRWFYPEFEGNLRGGNP